MKKKLLSIILFTIFCTQSFSHVEHYKDFKDVKLEVNNDNDDLNYSFLSKTFASLSKSQKEKILQVLRNTADMEKTG